MMNTFLKTGMLYLALFPQLGFSQTDIKTYGSDTINNGKFHLAMLYTTPYQKLIAKDSISDLHGYDFIVHAWVDGVSPSRTTLSGSGCSVSAMDEAGHFRVKISTGSRRAAVSISYQIGKKRDFRAFWFRMKGNLSAPR